MSNLRFNAPPGWPTPPAGWRPPAGWNPDPSWPPAPHGWMFWVDSSANPWQGSLPRPARSKTARGWMVAGAFASLWAAMFVFGVLCAAVMYAAAPDYMNDPAKTDETDSLIFGLMWLSLLGLVGVMAFLCPKVSYRSRDAFLVLVPFYGWFFFGMIVWRLTGLPHRDWAPRVDEVLASAHAPQPQAWWPGTGPLANR